MSLYVCTVCKATSTRWIGQCEECSSWNSIQAATIEETEEEENNPKPLCDVSLEDFPRLLTGITELDRVLGGGFVAGSLVLIGGEPGIGKSTLLLQALDGLARNTTVLYVSGEESARQTALRAKRLDVKERTLLFMTETRIESIIEKARKIEGLAAIVIDSIQTMKIETKASNDGAGQIREAAMLLLGWAKASDVVVILVGHVIKDGGLGGPKTLEHIVDTVIHFDEEKKEGGGEGRKIRATKNRFGSTNEVGSFVMTEKGLI